MLNENNALTEKDINEYENLLAYTQSLYNVTEEGYFKEGLDTTGEVLKHHGLIDSIRGFDLFSTFYEAIDKRISNPKFRDMLSYFIKYVGSSPYDAPAVLNMMNYMQHVQGVWYVPGGMHLLAEALVTLAKECGVKFRTNEEVIKLNQDGTNITGINLASGETITADYYISNMEVIPTYKYLLKEDKAFIDRLEAKFEPSSSGLVLHLGVNKTYPQLAHHNFFLKTCTSKWTKYFTNINYQMIQRFTW